MGTLDGRWSTRGTRDAAWMARVENPRGSLAPSRVSSSSRTPGCYTGNAAGSVDAAGTRPRRRDLLSSTADAWVVYDERAEGVCVEPQTAPPDAINLAAAAGEEPDVADVDKPMTTSMAWRWRDLGGRDP